MLINDANGEIVRTKYESIFPKGTLGEIISCKFVGTTTMRAYCIQTDANIEGLVKGLKSEWYLDRDLENTVS